MQYVRDARDARDPKPRWSVTVPFQRKDGSAGQQTFIVRADSEREAVAAAWTEAHQQPARASRRQARLTARRWTLRAQRVPGSEQ